MEEVWKPIEKFEKYLISNLGRVYSTKRNQFIKGTPDKKGYIRVRFYEKGKNYTCKVHRLVAQAFISNPNNLPQVNHKDENKANNCVNNLEWCDNSYNYHYGTRIERTIIANTNKETTSLPVLCIETNIIYPSMGDKYVDIRFNRMWNYKTDEYVKTSTLKTMFPEQCFTPQFSGIRVKSRILPDLWALIERN